MKNKNKFQIKNIIPLIVLSIPLLAFFAVFSSSFASQSFDEPKTQRGFTGNGEAEITAEAVLADPCGLDSVICDGEGSSNSVATTRVTSVPSLSQVISWYSSIDSCHTGASCLMANGKKAQIGYVACPRRYKLGTKVRIDGKTYECGDRTAKWVDGRWDIFTGYGIEAYHLALRNGIKKLNVEIIL